MPSRQPVVLHIDDDTAIRQLVRFILEQRNDLQLLEAKTGSQGIHLAEKHQPNVILLDLNLPDISGFNMLERMRKNNRTRSIPVIALTGSFSPIDMEKGLRAGFVQYLEKPINIARLNSAIDDIIIATKHR